MNDPTRHVRADLGSLASRSANADPAAAAPGPGKGAKIGLAAGLFALAGVIFAYNPFNRRAGDRGEAVVTTLSGGDTGAAGAATTGDPAGAAGDEPRRESFEVPIGGKPFATLEPDDPGDPGDPDAPEEEAPPPDPDAPPTSPPGGG